MYCTKCGGEIHPPARAKLTKTCLSCGELDAVAARKSWCVAPMNKSNYVLVTDPTMLKQLNPKRVGL
jgi:hypothetical protein